MKMEILVIDYECIGHQYQKMEIMRECLTWMHMFEIEWKKAYSIKLRDIVLDVSKMWSHMKHLHR